MSIVAHTPARILLIALSNVGDTVLSLPVLARLRAAYPSAAIDVVVGPRAQAVVLSDPRLRQVIVYDRNRGWAQRWQWLQRLRREHYDLVVDLRSTLWPRLLGARQTTSLWRQPPRAMLHRRDRHLWKLSTVGLPSVALSPTSELFPIPGAASQTVDAWLQTWQLNGRRLVAIAAGARSHIKRWRADGFAAVADRLSSEQRAAIVFTGEADERSVIDKITAQMQTRPFSVVGQTTLPELAALLGRCAVLVTNDSATLHLAGLVGTPTIAIFGPTDPRKYGPRGPRDIVLQQRLHCVPCEASLCRFQHECMRYLEPQEVYEAVVGVLENTKAISSQQSATSKPER
ncbi:MAG: glycosyltransferase family 9 protein [Candidatus Omnitrophica bacterium]|nr:glycosyltransferase family 9 protein [Candidatus Omnitrophota bacterium]